MREPPGWERQVLRLGGFPLIKASNTVAKEAKADDTLIHQVSRWLGVVQVP